MNKADIKWRKGIEYTQISVVRLFGLFWSIYLVNISRMLDAWRARVCVPLLRIFLYNFFFCTFWCLWRVVKNSWLSIRENRLTFHFRLLTHKGWVAMTTSVLEGQGYEDDVWLWLTFIFLKEVFEWKVKKDFTKLNYCILNYIQKFFFHR